LGSNPLKTKKTMQIFKKEITNKTILAYSLVLGVFIIYPNITTSLWFIFFEKEMEETYFFLFRYFYFVALFGTLLHWNFRKADTPKFAKRLLFSFIIAGIAYGLYVVISLYVFRIHGDHFTVNLVFQYIVALTISSGIGQVYFMYRQQVEKEREIEQLKLETLQSRYEALTNQINPHFFFNALNSLTGLIRFENKEVTLKFVDELSDVFRYILRSDKKGLVTLKEELDFMKSYQYLLEIRFAKKLSFTVTIPEDKMELQLPVLSLLPLYENVVQHNIIDSDNKMNVSLTVNENNELVVSNPIYPKLEESLSNHTGLSNLDSRFYLLTKKRIEIMYDKKWFTVSLPLVSEKK